MVRIVAGRAKGRQLKSPVGHTRPTSGRVRTSLFDSLAPWIIDRTVVDLCAGIGGLGIEALSRGAACAVFVDHNPLAVKTIRENLDRCDMLDLSVVWRTDAVTALYHLADADCAVDLILADPPYGDPVVHEIVRTVGMLPVLTRDGFLVIEHRRQATPEYSDASLSLVRRRHLGDTTLSLYCLDGPERPTSSQSMRPPVFPTRIPPPTPRTRR